MLIINYIDNNGEMLHMKIKTINQEWIERAIIFNSYYNQLVQKKYYI